MLTFKTNYRKVKLYVMAIIAANGTMMKKQWSKYITRIFIFKKNFVVSCKSLAEVVWIDGRFSIFLMMLVSR